MYHPLVSTKKDRSNLTSNKKVDQILGSTKRSDIIWLRRTGRSNFGVGEKVDQIFGVGEKRSIISGFDEEVNPIFGVG
jgi:hypothetical protein